MKDHKLLEMAAKAAGIQVRLIGPIGVYSQTSHHAWNPLVDDGDALRLAVKLNMLVDIPGPRESGTSIEVLAGKPKHGYAEAFEPEGPDPYAATRRAIVRAAAEIGKAMT